MGGQRGESSHLQRTDSAGAGKRACAAAGSQAGISPEAASSTLSQLLPTLVDKLTPNGQVPEHSNSARNRHEPAAVPAKQGDGRLALTDDSYDQWALPASPILFCPCNPFIASTGLWRIIQLDPAPRSGPCAGERFQQCESTQLHHAQPYCQCSLLIWILSSSRFSGDHGEKRTAGIGTLHCGVDHRRHRWIPGAQARADHNHRDAARPARGQAADRGRVRHAGPVQPQPGAGLDGGRDHRTRVSGKRTAVDRSLGRIHHRGQQLWASSRCWCRLSR